MTFRWKRTCREGREAGRRSTAVFRAPAIFPPGTFAALRAAAFHYKSGQDEGGQSEGGRSEPGRIEIFQHPDFAMTLLGYDPLLSFLQQGRCSAAAQHCCVCNWSRRPVLIHIHYAHMCFIVDSLIVHVY